VPGKVSTSALTRFTLPLPTLMTPAAGSVVAASEGYDRPAFTWTPLKDAESYSIRVMDLKTKRFRFTQNVGNATSYRPALAQALTPGRRYSWAVAVTARGRTTWSAAKPFSLALPMIAPQANATIAAASGYDLPTFSWAALSNATNYTLKVVDLTTQKALKVNVGNATTYTLTAAQALIPGRRFSWSIEATINGRPVAFAATRFTLAGPQLTPANNSTLANGNLTPTFTWAAVTQAVTYQFSLVDRTARATVLRETVGNVTSFTSPVMLKANHRYSWTIGLVEGNGKVIVLGPPSTFTLPS
jgi:hypothetical protein